MKKKEITGTTLPCGTALKQGSEWWNSSMSSDDNLVKEAS